MKLVTAEVTATPASIRATARACKAFAGSNLAVSCTSGVLSVRAGRACGRLGRLEYHGWLSGWMSQTLGSQ